MIRFYADSFAGALHRLELLAVAMLGLEDPRSGQLKVENVRKFLEDGPKSLAGMAEECSKTGFARLARRCTTIAQSFGSKPPAADLALVFDLLSDIRAELGDHLYFWVPGERRRWYADDDEALFGDGKPFAASVRDAIPGVGPELAEASRCFALARWTACVFHLMRAVEIALRKWADELGVTIPPEVSEWREILEAAEDRLEHYRKQPRTPGRTAAIEYEAELSAHFRTIKDAWRNHVSHSRTPYDERQATSILSHVQAFVEKVATPRPDEGSMLPTA
jgi:hypothetical protein